MSPFPEWLDAELVGLKGIGVTCEPKLTGDAKYPIVELEFEYTVPEYDKALHLVVRYPPLYPYFRCEVILVDMLLGHHQNPIGGNLCLLRQETDYWKPSMTAAILLKEQLPKIFQVESSNDPSIRQELEAIQAEPVSVYYQYMLVKPVLIDGSRVIDDTIQKGYLKLGYIADGHKFVVISILDQNQKPISADMNPNISRLCVPDIEIQGKWIRLEAPILEKTAVGFLEKLQSVDFRVKHPKWTRVGDMEIDIIGVLFPEEVAHREKDTKGWVFIMRQKAANRRGIYAI